MIDRKGPVPAARLARWGQEGAELSLEEDDGVDLHRSTFMEDE